MSQILKWNDEPPKLIVEICKQFYSKGWVSGTGGGISIKRDGKVYIAPSGVHKERMEESQIFILDGDTMKILYNPNDFVLDRYKDFKVSECHTLFQNAFEKGAGAVMHSHSVNAVLATMINSEATEFTCSHLEMIKGIRGHGYFDKLVVPIIENTAHEHELCDEMKNAMTKYPGTFAVLVRRHGVYVWGKDWIECKTHVECYDYLFGLVVEMHKNGIKMEYKK
jgi:methylthioribulose-1-phosphate dehydratase